MQLVLRVAMIVPRERTHQQGRQVAPVVWQGQQMLTAVLLRNVWHVVSMALVSMRQLGKLHALPV